MSAVGELWERAASWRWLVACAVIATALIAYLELTPKYHPASTAQRASYNPSIVQPETAGPVASSVTSPRRATPGPSAPSPAPQAADSPAFGSSYVPPTSSMVQPYSGPALGGSVTFVKAGMQGEVTGGGLVASYCCAGAFSTVYASRSVSSGKHYYELQLQTRKGVASPDSWTNAGVAREGSRPAPVGTSDRSDYSVIGRGQKQRYKDGDVFMFALDLDAGSFYYGVNGNWSNAVPGRDAGFPLDGRAAYIPYVTSSASSSSSDKDHDRWHGNFGQMPFRYTPPVGFAPYGATASRAIATTREGTATSIITPVAPDKTMSAVSHGGLMGKSFVDTITMSGVNVPLPEGTWQVVAFQRGGQQRPENEIAILANVSSHKQIAGLLAINAYTDPAKRATGFPQSNFCNRNDYVFKETVTNEAFGQQDCWWLNHAAQPWGDSVMRAARAELENHGVRVFPDALVNAGFRKADANRFLTVFVYFDPQNEGIQTQPSTWAASEWHRDRISSYPDKAQYIKKLESFGGSWVQLLRANF